MESFKSSSQYDKEYSLANNHNVCSFFSLCMAETWSNKHTAGKEEYELSLKNGVEIFKASNTKEIDFDTLLSFSDKYTGSDVNATMVDFIKDDDSFFNELFKLDSNKCYIFLKHEKFFVVICDKDNYQWIIRDCHLNDQLTFTDYDMLVDRLNSFYKFNETIEIDGYPLVEYSTIEYVLIDKPFKIKTKNSQPSVSTEDDDLARAIAESLEIEENNYLPSFDENLFGF